MVELVSYGRFAMQCFIKCEHLHIGKNKNFK